MTFQQYRDICSARLTRHWKQLAQIPSLRNSGMLNTSLVKLQITWLLKLEWHKTWLCFGLEGDLCFDGLVFSSGHVLVTVTGCVCVCADCQQITITRPVTTRLQLWLANLSNDHA